jgi:acetoin utilization deacetylase AcuC-like enzyme
MRIFYTDQFVLPLPEGHRFPMRKYALLRQRVAESGIVAPDQMIIPHAASNAELLRAHTADYVRRCQVGALTPQEIRRIGFPWSLQMVERSRRSSGATIEACRAALEDGVSANLAGGTHHAYADHGEGFCVFNDVAIAARTLQAEGVAARLAVIDCDVHQGNGTAAILAGDDSVFTLSIHAANNFPLHKEASDLDLALPDRAGDLDYLEAVEYGVQRALSGSRPSLVIYLAGADPWAGDTLGRLEVSKDGLAARDRLVFALCAQAGIPVAIVLSGGYAKNVEDTVDIHFQTAKTGHFVTSHP